MKKQAARRIARRKPAERKGLRNLPLEKRAALLRALETRAKVNFFEKEKINQETGAILRRWPFDYSGSLSIPEPALRASSYLLWRIYLNEYPQKIPLKQRKQISELIRVAPTLRVFDNIFTRAKLLNLNESVFRKDIHLDKKEVEILRKIVSGNLKEVYENTVDFLAEDLPDENDTLHHRFMLWAEGGESIWTHKWGPPRNISNLDEKYHLLKLGARDLREKLEVIEILLKIYAKQTRQRYR